MDFSRLVKSAREDGWTASDVARLAVRLADSGERLSWPSDFIVADVASTGGPGSLSTLLAPLALNACGAKVVKLGVPGRPAGAIDSLATLPGYQARLTGDEVQAVVSRCGFAHFLADARFAPMDAALYEYRRQNGSVDVPKLAAASLLAKKLAVGVRAVGLDVRVGPHGNFGKTVDEARENSRLFCAAASEAGIAAVALVSSAAGPPQPWVGRGESLLALGMLVDSALQDPHDTWLPSHFGQCLRMAVETWHARTAEGGPTEGASGRAPREDIRAALEAHLEAQGATLDRLLDRAEQVSAAERWPVTATASGRMEVDLGLVRSALVGLQQDDAHRPFADPAGVHILVPSGRYVAEGEILARVRCNAGGSAAHALVERLRFAFKVVPTVTRGVPTVAGDGAAEMEVIHA